MLSSPRTIAMAASFLLIFLLSLNGAPVNGSLTRVVAKTSASGELTVIWGQYMGPATIAEGSGRVVIHVRTEAAPGPNVYYFKNADVSVVLRADWTRSDGATYSLRARIGAQLSMTNLGTVYGDAHPDGTFIIYSTSFSGVLTVNGTRGPLDGTAKIWALTPEHSFQKATSDYLAVSLESGPYSIIMGWSQAAQTVGGIPLPQADHYSQQVRVIN